MKTLCFFALVLGGGMSLTSCGRYQSHLHEESSWRAYRKGQRESLPEVNVTQGQRVLAFEHLVGLPVPGGYNATFVAEDPDLVLVEYVSVSRGSRTYLTGLRSGQTRLYLVNGLAARNRIGQGVAALEGLITERTPSFQVTVSPPE